METRLFGAILAASPDPIYVLDLQGRIIYANKATANLFALELEAVIGKSNFDLGFPFASDIKRNQEKVISKQATLRGKLIHTFASCQGERFDYLLAPVLDEHQHTEATVCIFRDVTEQALAEEKIWHNAHHDALTGLPNRRLFLDRLQQEVNHANRSSLPLALLFMDLDGFKEVNDSLGHEDVELVAQSIIDALAKPFQTTQQPVQISASVGIAFYPRDASSTIALVQAADQAMYNAKKSGANRMYFYDTLEKTDRYPS